MKSGHFDAFNRIDSNGLLVGTRSGDSHLSLLAWCAWIRHCRRLTPKKIQRNPREWDEIAVWTPRPGEGGSATEHDDGRLEVIAWVPNELGQIRRIEFSDDEIRELLDDGGDAP